jgi:hypothetical protein
MAPFRRPVLVETLLGAISMRAAPLMTGTCLTAAGDGELGFAAWLDCSESEAGK